MQQKTFLTKVARCFLFPCMMVLFSQVATAEVHILNQTNSTVYASVGHHVNGGKLFYGGWHAIQNGQSVKVYGGNEDRIILHVNHIGNNNEKITQFFKDNAGSVDHLVSSDPFTMEELDGGVVKFTNRRTNQIFFKDNNNQWPPEFNLHRQTYFIVSGNQNHRLIP